MTTKATSGVMSAATTTAKGVVEQSTSAENVDGVSDAVFPSVAGTKEMIDTHSPASGKIAQIVHTQSGALFSGTTLMVADNTTPQNTEGSEWSTLEITPTSASSTLKIEVVLNGVFASVDADIVCALFRDSTADALASALGGTRNSGSAGEQTTISLTHFVSSGSTSATTFKVRIGPTTASTVKVNSTSSGGAAVLNGTIASTIVITEILP